MSLEINTVILLIVANLLYFPFFLKCWILTKFWMIFKAPLPQDENILLANRILFSNLGYSGQSTVVNINVKI